MTYTVYFQGDDILKQKAAQTSKTELEELFEKQNTIKH